MYAAWRSHLVVSCNQSSDLANAETLIPEFNSFDHVGLALMLPSHMPSAAGSCSHCVSLNSIANGDAVGLSCI